ncbi:DUF3352 domain-containing protein [Cyanobacteria bacterium FACHB-471]|nr:DUF3352 domain-containing protein [Cyanobacteria bacterium FACHB-471]
MKLRTFFYALAGSVLVLLLVAVGGFFWIAAHSPLSLLQGGGQASPAAAMFVPKQSPLMVSLLVKPDRLESFRLAIASQSERRRARTEINQLKNSLLTSTGLDYEQDVQPWLGDEVTFAVTTPDFDRDDENGAQVGYLVAIATQDPERSREFLQLFWQKRAIAGMDLVFEQYAGVKLIYSQPSPTPNPQSPTLDPQPSLATAVVGDRFVLFANHPKVLRAAINNVQAPGLSLSNSKSYQQALQRLPDSQIGLAFVNLPQLSQWLDGERTTETVSPYEDLVVALELDRQGLLAETALLTSPGEKLTPAKPALSKPVGALDFIPATSPLTAAGTDLQQFWNELSNSVTAYDRLSNLINQPLAELQAQWGIDLPEEVFSWVKDEYALGLLPRADQPQPDWFFVAKKADGAAEAVDHLDAIAQQQGLSLGTLTLGDQQTSAWTKLTTTAANHPARKRKRDAEAVTLSAEVQGIHTTVGNYEIFATSVEAMNQVLQATENPLLNDSEFQQAIAPLADANDGYLYLNWQSVHELVEQRFPIVKLAELAGKSFFDHVRSLTVSSYGSEANLRRGAVFVRLK